MPESPFNFPGVEIVQLDGVTSLKDLANLLPKREKLLSKLLRSELSQTSGTYDGTVVPATTVVAKVLQLLDGTAVVGEAARYYLAARGVGRITLNDVSIGSGWLCAPFMLVTALHVLAGVTGGSASLVQAQTLASQVKVVFNGVTHDATELWHYDEHRDVAMVRLAQRVDATPLGLVPSPPQPRCFAGVIHCPHGEVIVCRQDSVVLEMHDEHLWHTGDTDLGSSGAPIFDDEWRVCGIHLRLPEPSEELSDASLQFLADHHELNGAFNVGVSVMPFADKIAEAQTVT